MIVEGICCGYDVDGYGNQVDKNGIEISDRLKMYAIVYDEEHSVGKIIDMEVRDKGVWFRAEMDDSDLGMLSQLYPCAFGVVIERCGKYVKKFKIEGVSVSKKTADKNCKFISAVREE